MSRYNPETNTVEKCICEFLDMPTCTCPDDVRERLNVKLPKDGRIIVPPYA